MNNSQCAMIFAFFGVVDWWRYLGEHLGFEKTILVTDLRGRGDVSITADFYKELRRLRKSLSPSSDFLTEADVKDVIMRCRTLRWLEPHLARSMAHAMAIVFDRLLENTKPDFILSFPIDCYLMDVLERCASSRNIPYFELTASVFTGMSMLLHRGKLILTEPEVTNDEITEKKRELVNPDYVASYVPKNRSYTTAKFIKTLAYFRARAVAIKAISLWWRDTKNFHFLESQSFLGYKCRWKDIRIVRLVDHDWMNKVVQFPREKRILFGLQLFPEASIDYWIKDADLIQHEDMLIEAARVFSDAGFLVVIKDHPLQFGFRQTDVLKKMLAIENTILIPYEVGANMLLPMVGVNFTCTGTLGLQAALLGVKSVVTPSYYSNERDFIVFSKRGDIAELPDRVKSTEFGELLEDRQRTIIRQVLHGSFEGNLFCFQKFDINSPSEDSLKLAHALQPRLSRLMEMKEYGSK